MYLVLGLLAFDSGSDLLLPLCTNPTIRIVISMTMVTLMMLTLMTALPHRYCENDHKSCRDAGGRSVALTPIIHVITISLVTINIINVCNHSLRGSSSKAEMLVLVRMNLMNSQVLT